MKRQKLTKAALPVLPVVFGKCLGHPVYRGFAPLRTLASISKADIFDQHDNPLGTQRNLNKDHARKAYSYVTTREDAFYPEIILNLRDVSYVKFERMAQKGGAKCGFLRFVKDPTKVPGIVISRLDGNHRLWYGAGQEKGFDPVARQVSFCLLTLDGQSEELALFRDINDNQMGMNTSHLHNIATRLSSDTDLKHQNPALYIVQKLQRDRSSPLYRRMHEGGRVRKGATLAGLTLANLVNAVRDMLSRSTQLARLDDVDAQYRVIRNYWRAVKNWLPGAWTKSNEYSIFKGVGLYAITYLGVGIIDMALQGGKYQPADFERLLANITSKDVFRARKGLALAGRSGGRQLANSLLREIEADGKLSMAQLQRKILGDKS